MVQNLLLVLFCIFNVHLLALNSDIFYKKLQEPTPEWMKEQIQHDLSSLQKKLSEKCIDELFENRPALVRVKVAQNKLIIHKSKKLGNKEVADLIVSHLMELHNLVPLPDVDFLISTRDFFTLDNNFQPCQLPDAPNLPILIMSKCKKDNGLIIIPDWFALNGYEPEKSLVLEGNRIYPWEQKLDLLFFRGANSGVWDRVNWRSAPRPKLAALSLQYPHLIDAKFSHLLVYEKNPEMGESIKNEGMLGDRVSMKEHPRFRYLINVEGHCASAPRFPLLLHSNSVVFSNVTDSLLWFYGAIKPFIHFIPVAEDLSDLLSQLEWAMNHDNECRRISENARQFASENLTQESAYLYMYRLLEEYSKQQREYYHLE